MKKLMLGLAIALAAAGCSGKKTKEAGATTATIDDGALFPGPAPTLPKPFAKLHLGMTLAEARAAAPAFFVAGDDQPHSPALPEYPSARFDLYLDDDTHKVSRQV